MTALTHDDKTGRIFYWIIEDDGNPTCDEHGHFWLKEPDSRHIPDEQLCECGKEKWKKE